MLISRSFICNDCNSDFGLLVDSSENDPSTPEEWGGKCKHCESSNISYAPFRQAPALGSYATENKRDKTFDRNVLQRIKETVPGNRIDY